MFGNFCCEAEIGWNSPEVFCLSHRLMTGVVSRPVWTCLLSFETQVAMQQGLLDRPEALSILSGLLDNGETGAGTASTDPIDPMTGQLVKMLLRT